MAPAPDPVSVPQVTAVGLPWIDVARRETRIFDYGATLAEIVAALVPAQLLAGDEVIRVTIGRVAFEPPLWPIARPHPGACVIVRVLPGNSGAMRSVLLLSATVAAVALGQLWAGPALAGALGFASGTTAFATTVSAVTAGLLLAGNFLVNALVPTRNGQQAGSAANSQSYSIAGWSNPITPGGVVPFVCGTMRVALLHASLPYRDIVNGDTHSVALLTAGYGGLEFSDPRIGDTPIDRYKQVAWEWRGGWEDEDPVTLYDVQVIQEDVSVELSSQFATSFGPDSRYSASAADNIFVEVTMPAGLIAFTEVTQGDTKVMQQGPWGVTFRIETREQSSASWASFDWTVSGMQQWQLTAQWEWRPPTPGRYEVRVFRLDADWDYMDQSAQTWRIISKSYWTALSTDRWRYPINIGKPISLFAIDIRANEQINGRVDAVNLLATRVALDWDGSEWSEAPTQSPASMFRAIAQGPMNPFPRPDEKLDLERLAHWHEFCAARGLGYSRLHDFASSLSEVLADIASAGRAVPIMRAGKLSVGIDEPKTEIEGWITPRNSRNFRLRRSFVRIPHAFRVKFRDASNNYEWAERIVLRPDFIGDPVDVEELTPPGVTDPDIAYREGLRRFYELQFRLDEYSVEMDYESMTFERFSRVMLSHDVLDAVHVSGRVRAVSGNSVLIDKIVTMEAGKTYGVVFRSLGSADPGPGVGITRLVTTAPGETTDLLLVGSGALPEVGDLAMFGLAGEETVDCVVKTIASTGIMDRLITLVDHAPQIHTLADEAEVPEWDPSIGADVDTSYLPPSTPSLATVTSTAIDPAVGSSTLFVALARGAGGGPVSSYSLQHRLQGAGGWTTVTFGASPGTAIITAYAAGAIVELRAAASGPGGDSAYSSIDTHTIAATDAVANGVVSFAVAQLDASTWRFTFATQPGGSLVIVKYRAGHWTRWADLTAQLDVLSASPHDDTMPAIVSTQEYSFGARLVDSSGVESGAPLILQVTAT